MASYNHAPFIRTAVESVLRQTFADWELVITDDGSTDGTLAALDGITDNRLRIEGFPENRSRPLYRGPEFGRCLGTGQARQATGCHG
jgi:glycosyltransferase involved in cell wall biosynthesis